MPRKRKTSPLQSGQPITPSADEKAKQERLTRLEKWKTRVSQAMKRRREWELDFRVEDLERFFLGDQLESGRKKKQDLVFNHFRAKARTLKPNLFYTAPKFFVRPLPGLRPPAEELNAAIGESVLEAIGNQDQNLKRAASLSLWQAFFRVGVLKTCYDPRLEPNPQAGQPVYQEDDNGPVMDEMGRPKAQINPLDGKPMVEPEKVLTDDVYRYDYVDARRLLLPDEGPDQSKWTWIGEEITVSLKLAQQDTRFPPDRREALTANGQAHETERGARPKLERPESDPTFTYLEVYDLLEKTLLIWADGQTWEDFLVEEPLPAGIEDHPYALLMLGDPITGPIPSPWPAPFTRSWLDPCREYNINRKQIQNAAKRSARKGVYFANSFDNVDEAVKVLQSPDDMTFALCSDPAQVPQILTEPPLNSDVYKAAQMTLMDLHMITGVTGARSTVTEGSTATEQSYIERAANLRDADTQDAVNDWLSEAGQKMFQLVKGTLTMDVWIKLRSLSDSEFLKLMERRYGIPADQLLLLEKAMPGLKEILKERVGKEQWRRVTREQLTFEADVSVAPGSARPRNLDAERQAWMDFLKLLGMFPQLALSRELLKETAQKFDGFISERMIDEINALAEKMVGIQSQIAGRNQGGQPNPGAGTGTTAGNPQMAALLSGIQGGLGAG